MALIYITAVCMQSPNLGLIYSTVVSIFGLLCSTAVCTYGLVHTTAFCTNWPIVLYCILHIWPNVQYCSVHIMRDINFSTAVCTYGPIYFIGVCTYGPATLDTPLQTVHLNSYVCCGQLNLGLKVQMSSVLWICLICSVDLSCMFCVFLCLAFPSMDRHHWPGPGQLCQL